MGSLIPFILSERRAAENKTLPLSQQGEGVAAGSCWFDDYWLMNHQPMISGGLMVGPTGPLHQ
jgi:hypothetical protein